MITLIEYTMDIKAEIDKLNLRRIAIEKIIENAKEEIRHINIKGRKLQTILKHAEAALSNEAAESEPAEHPEA